MTLGSGILMLSLLAPIVRAAGDVEPVHARSSDSDGRSDGKEKDKDKGDDTRQGVEVNQMSDSAPLNQISTMRVEARVGAKDGDMKRIETLYANSPDNLPALHKVLKQVATETGMDATKLTKAFIQLRLQGMGESFSVEPKQLITILKDWTPAQRSKFSDELSHAVSISEKSAAAGKPMTNEEAFTQALKDDGLLEAYRKGCRS